MKKENKAKQTHRYREQISGYREDGGPLYHGGWLLDLWQ